VSRAFLFAFGCSLTVSLACSDDHDEGFRPYPPPAPDRLGSVEFSWSIDGEQDPAACVAAEAATFQSLIADGGYIVESVAVPCERFEASLPLFIDDFRARSALVSVTGYPVMGRIVEALFVVESGHVTRLVIDFPSRSVPVPQDAGAEPGADAGGLPPETTDAGLLDAGTSP
jgi:hypothetical protein